MTFLVLSFLLCVAADTKSAPADAALAQVMRQVAGVAWNASPEIADFDCDGKSDFAFLGKRDNKILVAFRLTRSRKVQWFEFGIDSANQESICEEPAEIYVEDLDTDPSDAVDGVQGFKVSKSCKGLQLVGGECDFFHFYWNHARKHIDWWRL